MTATQRANSPLVISRPGIGIQYSKNTNIVKTPFYRTVDDFQIGKCSQEPDFNYNAYTLAVLKSRLIPFFRQMLNKTFSIQFPSIRENNKYYITVVPTKGGEPIELDSLQAQMAEDYINDLSPETLKYLVLYTRNSIETDDGKLIPSFWIESILPFIQLDSTFRGRIGPYGLEVDFSKIPNFHDWMQTMIIEISKQIRKMYEIGYIVDPSNDIISNWSLLPVETRSYTIINKETEKGEILDFDEVSGKSVKNISRLYYSSWMDQRITDNYGGMTSFLLFLIKKNIIKYEIQNVNLVRKHFIAKILANQEVNVIFDGKYIKFAVNSLRQTQDIIYYIEEAISLSNGKVITFSVTRLSWLILYATVSTEFGFTNCVGYRIFDDERPYVFSCIINMDLNLLPTYQEYHKRVMKLLSNLSISWTDTTISIHEAIERNLISFK